eukprot:616879_1
MALTYIEQTIVEYPNSGDDLRNCKNLYQKKLWHQLTDALDKLIATSKCSIDFIVFEAKFIRGFRKYMNTLRYGSLVIEIAARCYAQRIINEIQGIAFCEQALSCIENDEKESQKEHFDDKKIDNTQTKLLINTQIALFELRNGNNEYINCFNTAKTKLDEVSVQMEESVRACPPLIYSRYHFVCSKLWASQEEKNELPSDVSWTAMFYKHAMSYLGYTALSRVTNPSKWANDIALAALVAPDFYDFGELSLHPIMKSLEDTPQQWVLNMVKTYISADVDSYNDVITKYKENIQKNNVLQTAKPKDILSEKIQLLSLVRLAFDKASFERIISFEEIRNATQCDENAVEYLIMKAMSLKLIKGVVDEIDRTVQIQWVKPAILDISQMQAINKKVNAWIAKIQQTQTDMTQ